MGNEELTEVREFDPEFNDSDYFGNRKPTPDRTYF